MKNVIQLDHVRIEKDVHLTIFENPNLKRKIQELFSKLDEKIQKRISEILEFLDMQHPQALCHENITSLFRAYFYELILNDAIELALSQEGRHNIMTNIELLLSEAKLTNAIYGKPMIEAFSRAINSIPNDNLFDSYVRRRKILLLQKNYLTKPQRNGCGGCGCSCICDASCDGDRSKCTNGKKCNNHCGCYLTLLATKLL